jgi:hypothetical protein
VSATTLSAASSAPEDPQEGPRQNAAVDDAYLAEQPPDARALLVTVRALGAKAVPDASVSIKWGVPVYAKNGKNVCALATFTDHIGLNIFAPPDVLTDPGTKLEGGGKGSRC